MSPDELKEIVRRNIENGRFRNVQAIAVALGVSTPSVYRWMKGEIPIIRRTAEAIKNILS